MRCLLESERKKKKNKKKKMKERKNGYFEISFDFLLTCTEYRSHIVWGIFLYFRVSFSCFFVFFFLFLFLIRGVRVDIPLLCVFSTV